MFIIFQFVRIGLIFVRISNFPAQPFSIDIGPIGERTGNVDFYKLCKVLTLHNEFSDSARRRSEFNIDNRISRNRLCLTRRVK